MLLPLPALLASRNFLGKIEKSFRNRFDLQSLPNVEATSRFVYIPFQERSLELIPAIRIERIDISLFA